MLGYCLQHFNDKQIETFHGYLAFLVVADMMFRKTPSELVRQGDAWVIQNKRMGFLTSSNLKRQNHQRGLDNPYPKGNG
ncbi:MAG: hypothetical protein IPM91_16065 [Bacteroidetes bacterium]|nr:hypothetical protein [Bacteroidota bacterium]